MPPEQRKTVRDYIPPADSTSLIDMLRTWTGVENIDEIYSQNIADIPVNMESLRRFGPMALGAYYSPIYEGDNPKIGLDSSLHKQFYKYKDEGKKYVMTGEAGYPVSTIDNVIHHEAFGHALLDALSSYYEVPDSMRQDVVRDNEIFPAFIEGFTNLSYPERLGSYSGPLENIEAVEELNKLSKEKLSGLLGLIESSDKPKGPKSPTGSSLEEVLGAAYMREKMIRQKRAGIKLPPTGDEAWDW